MDEISLRMSEGEALVLFEFLQSASTADGFATPSERIVVWRTICLLEKKIPSLFDPRYGEIVTAARARIEAEG